MSLADASKPIDVATKVEQLTASLEQASAEGRGDVLSPAQLQDLLAALCRTYVAQLEAVRG